LYYLFEVSFNLISNSFTKNERLGQMPVTAANKNPAAGAYTTQFTLANPEKKIPVQRILLIKANQVRIKGDNFVNFLAGIK
jgi:hypothetical protein